MKIGYLGTGTWGFTLSCLLASKGHQVILWGKESQLMKQLFSTREHPRFPGYVAPEGVVFTPHLELVVQGSDVLVESVSSVGVRPVFLKLAQLGRITCPIVLTSKGVEKDSCLLLPEVVLDVLGASYRSLLGCLSGPSHAEEVIQKLPASVVASAYDRETMFFIRELFSTPLFRVYPNEDIHGVAFGGAMKNIIAVACGLSDGLTLGDNAKAALMTRGLHEMRRLSVVKEAKPDTLNGLSGLGDLFVTCLSRHSRNYRFGYLLSKGISTEEAQQEIGMVVEGCYTAISALQLAKRHDIQVPITKAVHSILYEALHPQEAVRLLLDRPIREEYL